MSKRQVSLTIVINGKEVSNTLQGVGAEIGRLRKELRGINESDPEFSKKVAELNKAKQRYAEINREINGLSSSFDKASLSGNALLKVFAAYASFSGLKQGFQKLIDLSAELADKQADVQKTTGMTKAEVRALTHELDKLETRTSRTDLLSIAEEGGRIGIAKEEIADFTEAMNKANVALGDVFGSAEEVASTLGKLRFLYKETAEMGVSEAYNAIGSALNELGANGVASEQNIAAFATRVGALPNAFKPAIADAMALGAAFEESGVNAEVAGRSYGILIQAAANNTAAFSKQMNISREELEKMINDDPVEFFLKFSESFKGMDRDGVQMAKTLKALGISADGVNKIIGAAANNNDRFRESIALSNEAMEEGTSLTDEYNVKNENLAATIEKINKTFVEWIDSDVVQDFIEGLVEWFGMLIGAVGKSDEELTTLQKSLNFAAKAFAVLIASLVSYQAAMRLSIALTNSKTGAISLNAIATKGAAAGQRLWTIAVLSGSVVVNTFTGNVGRASAAMRVLNTVTRMNPFGLIFGAITAVVGAIYYFTRETNKAAKAQKEFSESIREAHKTAAEETGKSVAAVKSLINVIKDESASMENRKRAYQELIKIAPEFNGLLQDEIFNIKELTRVYEAYVTQLTKVAQAKATKQIHEDAQAAAQKGKSLLYSIDRELADKMARLKELDEAGENKKYLNTASFGSTAVNAETRETEILKREIKKLSEEKSNLLETQKELDKQADHSGDFLHKEAQRIERRIAQEEELILQYEKKGESHENYIKAAKGRLKGLKAELAALGLSGSPDDDYSSSTSSISIDPKKEDPEIERRRRVAEELLKIEVAKNRRIRDEKLKNREEEIALMEEGFDKELALLNVEKEKRLNKLEDELEDLNLLRKEYERRAQEERKKGNSSGADGFAAQAEELKEIENELLEERYFANEAFLKRLQTLKMTSLTKEVDEQQKAYDRELMNLQTHHNNQLKALVDLESAKEVLKSEYGFSDDELKRLKSFEQAKSAIVLEQQKVTFEKQSELLQSQIDQLEGVLALDDASVFGKLFNEEQRDEVLLFIEELKNKLSEISKPEQERRMSFIDIFGFSADQWQEAFDNLDTLSGKLSLVQMGVQALSNAWGQYHALQQRNMQRDLDEFTSSTNRKKEALQKQLDEGYISEASYNAKIAKLDAELENRRAEMEYKSAMAEWKMALLQAATNTAVGITAALPNIPLSVLVGALGAVQIGMIAANKPEKREGYFTGGETGGSGEYDAYGRELADGPLHAREYVIPEYLRRDPVIARMEEFIEARRRGMSPTVRPDGDGSPDGAPSSSTPVPISPSNAPDKVSIAILGALEKLNDNLEYLQENPLEAKLPRNLEVAKKLSDDIEDYKKHRNKNRR